MRSPTAGIRRASSTWWGRSLTCQPSAKSSTLWRGSRARQSRTWAATRPATPGRPLPGGRLPLPLVHDEAGTVFCYDTVGDPPVKHKTSYVGYEEGRGTVRHRCPARHEGGECPSDDRCNAGLDWGLTARLP